RNQIANGTFHHTPGRRGAEINQLPRGKQSLQLGLNPGVKIFESLSTVTDHWRSERAKRFLADLDRTRNMQFDMCHKGREIFHMAHPWARLELNFGTRRAHATNSVVTQS